MVVDHGKRTMPGRTVANQIAQLLERLRKSRVIADYDIKAKLTITRLNIHLKELKKIFLLCEEFQLNMASTLLQKLF